MTITGLSAELLKKLTDHGSVPMDNYYEEVSRIPSGSLSFDWALGGGLPRGRFMTCTGEPSYGKTTVALIAAQYVTRHPDEMLHDGRVAFFDMENTYSPAYAASLGIDRDRFHLYQPDSGEQALDTLSLLIEQNIYDLIIFDSVAETAFIAELEAKAGDSHVGVAARKWSQFRRKIKGSLSDSDTCLWFINQTYKLVGVTYGPDEADYGGRALPFGAVIRVKMLSPTKLPHSITFRPKIAKNKTAAPGREASITLGLAASRPFVNVVPELTQVGKELFVFTDKEGAPAGKGGWYFNGEKIGSGSGEPPVQKELYANKDLRKAVEARVREAIVALNQPGVEPDASFDPLTGEVLESEGDGTL